MYRIEVLGLSVVLIESGVRTVHQGSNEHDPYTVSIYSVARTCRNIFSVEVA
jgi:hypothetical protein